MNNGLPAGRLEGDFRNAVIERVSARGVATVWAQNAGKVVVGSGRHRRAVKLGDEGISDIIGVTGAGTFVAFEVKSPARETTPAQLNFLAMITRRGGVALLYRYDPALDWLANVAAATAALAAQILLVEQARRPP